MDNLTITLLIIILTIITSLMAFNNAAVRGSAIFYPYAIRERGEWYRFITSGFIHADYMHLGVNMFVLWSFGDILEKYYLPALFHSFGRILFVVIYIGGMIVSDIPSYFKHRHDATYRALGASGAVSAVVFACILIGPFNGSIGIIFIPGVGIPPIIFGALYLAYSIYMSRAGRDNVNHDAHFYGALFGFLLPGILKPQLFTALIEQIKLQLL